MECLNLLQATIDQENLSKVLFQDATDKELITELQRILFELGFRKELNWDSYQADGIYGPKTSKAVAAFALKNDIKSDGTKVTKKLAKLMLERHGFLSSMYILSMIHQSDLRKTKFISKGNRTSITAVQSLLNQRGYGKHLNFAKFGADGFYGKHTKKAFIAYAKDNGITDCDGDTLTRPMINLMMKDINQYYGKHWTEQTMNHFPDGKSPLIIFEGSRFRGAPCEADIQFRPMLERINGYAEQADVFVHVTSSFRTSTNVKGAIVPPAKFSNHMAGHGIDMNVIYGDNKLAKSHVLTKYPNVPKPVKAFLKLIIDDPELRWGGKFRRRDPVHIDDHLNKDRKKWMKRYKAMQMAVQLGK